jgi:hypothetical protein
MAANRIADMTLDELTQFIDRRIKRALSQREDKRTMTEVNASIRRNRIVPPSGSKSALQMLREDRDA